jgi:hypothetical protein
MKDCFGTIYPDVEQVQFGSTVAGKVFRIRVSTLGPGHRDRKLEVDQREWQECQRCEDFRNCYDFSNAKLKMQQMLAQL